ncbi:MAG: peptidase [marine bacterium B5-7]|nr:MAG: peptidase [marine bacterium B5-7]
MNSTFLVVMLAVCAAWAEPLAAFENFESVPGGISGVLLRHSETEPPMAFFGNHPVLVQRHPEGWVAVVGLDRDLAPGFYVVNTIDSEERNESYTFTVRPGQRPIYEVLAPPDSDLEAVAKRHMENLDQMPKFPLEESESPPDLDFVLPVDQDIRLQYGYLNFRGTGLLLAFPGLGFDPAPQSEVVNPSFGQVISVDETYGGSRVVIYHGAGVVSVFNNLERVSVSSEDWVFKDAEIGILKQRETVALLPDWSVYLNGAAIDPLLLVSQKINLEPITEEPLAPPLKID